MHDAAKAFVTATVERLGLADVVPVLDLGGRTVNDSIHSLFSNPVIVVDIVSAPDVNIVADAADWEPDQQYAVVLATEVFEHTPRWREIIDTAEHALAPNGWLIATCARDARPPHGAEGGAVGDEWYANVGAEEMWRHLQTSCWGNVEITEADGYFGDDDLYVIAQVA